MHEISEKNLNSPVLTDSGRYELFSREELIGMWSKPLLLTRY